MITIASAGSPRIAQSCGLLTALLPGCNAFDYLIEGARVTAVDFNGAQIALTEAKAACCQHIEFEEFFQIFAKNDIDLFRRKYFEVIRSHLSMPSQRFWDSHIKRLERLGCDFVIVDNFLQPQVRPLLGNLRVLGLVDLPRDLPVLGPWFHPTHRS